MNWFDQNPQPEPSDPPPPKGEGDYGENVVTLTPKGRRGQAGWKSEWQLSENGSPLPNLRNTMIALREHPTLSKLIQYDEMARSAVIIAQIPGTPHDPTIPREMRDTDVLAIQEEIQITGLRRIAKMTIQDAASLRADQDRFHPVRDYLDGLVWDGTPRVDAWLTFYLGAEPNSDLSDDEQRRKSKYISKIGRLFLIALVARIYRPGCKADYMLILEGPQGALKSSACRVLAGEWFSDNLPDLSRGDAVRLSMHLRGKWLIEIGEMASFNAAEAHTLKEFLTQTDEKYTPKYGHKDVKEPRQCLFIGSTNDGTYLRDATGARRFWPVKVGTIDLDGLTADRNQLLAEAVKLFRDGEPWWPDRKFEAEYMAPEQAARYEEDAWQEVIVTWAAQNSIRRCTVNDVLRGPINLPTGQFGTREQRRVSAIFRHLQWSQSRTNGKTYFERPVQGSPA